MVSQNLIPSKSKFCFSYWQICVLHRLTVSWLQTSASELTSPLLSTIWDTGFHPSIFSHNLIQLTTRSVENLAPPLTGVSRTSTDLVTVLPKQLSIWGLWCPGMKVSCEHPYAQTSCLLIVAWWFYYWMSMLITLGFRLGIVSRSSSARLRAKARINVRQPQGLWPQDERKQPSHLPVNSLIYSATHSRRLVLELEHWMNPSISSRYVSASYTGSFILSP